MTQPVAYVPATAFSAFAPAGFPNHGANTDTEFQAIKTTTDQIRTNLAILQRDDTNLANGIVTPDSLSALTKQLIATTGWEPKGAWLTATAYALKDVVVQSSIGYVCLVAHTSGVFATDLAAGKWAPFTTAYTTTAFGLSLLAAADATATLTLLGLTITAYAKTLLDDADAAAARATLGVQGKMYVPFSAGAFTSRLVTGPGRSTTESTTHKVLVESLDFDASVQEYAQIRFGLPKSVVNGAFTYRVRWTAESGSGDATWSVRAQYQRNDDPIDAAWGTAVNVVDTLLAAKDEHLSAESGTVTPAGTFAAECTLVIELSRVTGGLAVDARMAQLDVFFTTNAGNDA